MKTSGQLQKKATAQSAPIPVSTNLFHRPFSKPSATAEAASTDTPDFQARLDFARIHAPNLNSLAANSSGDRAPSTVQPKLTVGAPNDQYEQEADRVADQVMGMPDSATQQPIQREAMPEEEEVRTKPLAASITPLVQREAMPEEEEIRTKPIATLQREEIPEEEESVSLQRSPDGNLQAGEGIESRLNQSKGGGSPLSDEVRSFMEPRFGADFSQVRVHTGSEAVQMSRDLNAHAFTHGEDVYFGAGKSPGRDELTAHELTHIVQQTGVAQRNGTDFLDQGKLPRHYATSPSRQNLQVKSIASPSQFAIQRDKIDYKTLVWDDFMGRAPSNSTYDAETATGCHPIYPSKIFPRRTDLVAVNTGETTRVGRRDLPTFKVSTQINSANIQVKPYMWQERSWHRKSDDNLLMHEQTHFDITRSWAETTQSLLRALVINSAPSEVTGTNRGQTINRAFLLISETTRNFNKELKMRFEALESIQKEYDSKKGSNHGMNTDKQAEWTKNYRPQK